MESDKSLFSKLAKESDEMGINDVLEVQEQMNELSELGPQNENEDEEPVRTVITNSSR